MTNTYKHAALKRAACFFFFMLAILLSGCSNTRYDDPVVVMQDPAFSCSARLSAASQAIVSTSDSPEFRQQLQRWLFTPVQPRELRMAAINYLLQIDSVHLQHLLAEKMDQIPDDAVYIHAANIAVERQWQSVTVPVIRRYKKQLYNFEVSPPDHAAILKQLHPNQTLTQVIMNVFTDSEKQYRQSDRMIAWVVLYQLLPEKQLQQILMSISAGDASWIADMQMAWQDLNVLIATRDELLQLTLSMRHPLSRQNWQHFKNIIATLSDHQKKSLALRHLPMLLVHHSAQPWPTRQQLLEQIASQLVSQTHYHRASEKLDSITNQNWADLLVLSTFLDIIRQPVIVDDIFAQADLDIDQTNTELGGLVFNMGNEYFAIDYPPGQCIHDQQFNPPDEMIQRLYHALAHYHFHAQSYNNSRLAGPGAADLRLANNLRLNYLLFTFIDRNTLNVDLYLPDDRVFDLGIIRRKY